MTPVLNTANKVYAGTSPATAVYLGATKVWPSGPPPFVPTSLLGLMVWLDASQLTLADGAAVSPWPDLSGQANHGTIVGTPAPKIRANALNGKPVVRFTINEGRVRGSNGLVSGVPSYNSTVAYVSRMVTSNVGRIFAARYPEVNYLLGTYVNGYDVMYDGGFVGGSGIGYPALPTPWKMYGSDASHDGTNYLTRFLIDGAVAGTATIGAGLGTGYNLSGYSAAGTEETCDCEVAELLIYNRKLPDADRQTVETYLRGKWGL